MGPVAASLKLKTLNDSPYHNWAITSNLSQSFMAATASVNNIKRFSLKKGYVAFTKDSETRDDIGIPAYIADDLDNTVLGYHCALVKPNTDILSGKYLNAFLHSDYIKKYFELNATGSGMRYTLSTETLNNIPILAPSLEMQEFIGNIFSDIDRKICLNRQINDNLRSSRAQSQTQFELCRGAAVNADVSPNLPTLDRSLRGEEVRLVV